MAIKKIYLEQSVIDKIKYFSDLYGIKESQFVSLVLQKHFGDEESEITLDTFQLSSCKDMV